MAMTPETGARRRSAYLTNAEQQAKWYFGAARAYRERNPVRAVTLFNHGVDLLKGKILPEENPNGQ